MTGDIAVREGTQLLQVDEAETVGVREERRENAEAGAFVNDAIEPFVGKRGCGIRLLCLYQQSDSARRNDGSRRPAPCQLRRRPPW